MFHIQSHSRSVFFVPSQLFADSFGLAFRLVPFTLDYTRLARSKTNREPVRRLPSGQQTSLYACIKARDDSRWEWKSDVDLYINLIIIPRKPKASRTKNYKEVLKIGTGHQYLPASFNFCGRVGKSSGIPYGSGGSITKCCRPVHINTHSSVRKGDNSQVSGFGTPDFQTQMIF